jgi:hypothetical protein
MAERPVHYSLLFRASFHNPQLYASTPLTRSGLLSSFSIPTFSIGDLDILHGLYQRLEQDSRDARLKQFKEGKTFYLQHEINNEIRAAVKDWKYLWRKMSCNGDVEYDSGMDDVHFQWISRSIEHLRKELYLLSTARRAHLYLTSVEALTVQIPM